MRRDSLARRLELLGQTASRQDDPASVGLERQEALERLAALKEAHREALLLIGWDGLTATEAAEASGLKPSAFRTRLHRARQELESIDLLQNVVGKETS